MSIRLAVIGAGIMGADHARIIAEELPGAVLQVVCDAAEPRARQVAEAYGAADVGTDPWAVIARKDVDAVLIASPDPTHAPLTLAALDADKPVLCEKPLAPTSAECLGLIQAEVAKGRQMIQLGFMRRFDQSYVEMKRALRNGDIGRALMMHNFHRNVETPAADFTGAMAITNSAPHEFDVVRHVLNTEYKSISAWQPTRSDDVVAPVFMVIETTDGQLVNIEINNNAAYGYDVRAELVGEQGGIAMNHVAYTRIDNRLKNSIGYDADWRSRYAEAYRRQNRAFLHMVETGEFSPIASSSWDGYCAAVVAEAGVKALASGTRVPVRLAEKPSLYNADQEDAA